MKQENYFKTYKRYYTYIAPLFKSRQVKNYTYLILTFFTAAFFAYSAIKPTVTTIIGLRRQILDGRYSDTKLQEKITALSKGQEIVSGVTADFPIIAGVLPSNPNLSLLVRQIENSAYSSSVSFSSLSFEGVSLRQSGGNQEIKPKTILKNIVFNLTVSGPYENIIKFLENIRNIRRIIVIENIQINKEKNQEGALTLTAQAKAFYRE